MLNRVTYKFTLDLRRPTIAKLKVVNGDTANTFEITVKDAGAAITLDPDLHKVIAVFERADGQIYTQDASTGLSFTAAGVVTIDVRPASFRTGTNTVKLQIYKRESSTDEEYPLLLTTYEQVFTARMEAIPEAGAPNAPSQLPMLEQLIADAGDAVDACEAATAAANEAASSANAAAAAAAAAATDADNAANAAWIRVDACNIALANVSDATNAANQAASSANQAANVANEAAAAANEAERDAGHAAQAATIAANSANTAATAANTAAQGANAARIAANNAESAATSAALVADSAARNADTKAAEAETAAAAANAAANAANAAATAATAAMPVIINVRDITWNEDYTAGNGYADVDIDAIMTAVGNGAIVMMDVPHENIRMYYSLKDGGDIGFSSARLVPLSTIQFWFALLYKVPNETACRVSIRMRTVSST